VLEKSKLAVASLSSFVMLLSFTSASFAEEVTFAQGTATPSETCGECHGAVYREYTLGIGSDNHSAHAQAKTGISAQLRVSSSGTAHAAAVGDVRGNDKKDFHCNSCHFPDAFNITDSGANGQVAPKTAAAANEGLTCASCHLTPDGYIRATHSTSSAPHKTIKEPALQNSMLCGHCHGYQPSDKRVVGKMKKRSTCSTSRSAT
jgi:nitrate/TMAO reductase-like tetraheme cytochrome c subunit